MKGSDKNKAILLVVLLLLVAAVAAWNFGLFGGGKGTVVAPTSNKGNSAPESNANNPSPDEPQPANRRIAPK